MRCRFIGVCLSKGPNHTPVLTPKKCEFSPPERVRTTLWAIELQTEADGGEQPVIQPVGSFCAESNYF